MARAPKEPSFDDLVQKVPEPFQTALVEVLDSADLCRRWFAEAGMEPTAADVVAMTKLVLTEAARIRINERIFPEDDA